MFTFGNGTHNFSLESSMNHFKGFLLSNEDFLCLIFLNGYRVCFLFRNKKSKEWELESYQYITNKYVENSVYLSICFTFKIDSVKV